MPRFQPVTFKNITSSTDTVPEGIANKMIAIAALYVPLDGINEAGLCIADLEVNEGGMIGVDTDKPNLTVTTATRLLLNEAATVDEAIALLKQYDIFPSGSISHHFAIADATGKSVAIEFVNGEPVVIESNFLTNFNLANGDTAAGGESAKQRYETLISSYDENNGIFTAEQTMDLLSQVSKSDEEFSTQWSIVYDGSLSYATYYFNQDYSNAYTMPINN